MLAVRGQNISKQYKLGDSTISALSDVNFEIRKGEVVTLSGRSGSGKSTLLNIIGLLDTPDTGEIQIAGQNIQYQDDWTMTHFRRHHIGYVFQTFNLIPVLSVFENVEYPLALQSQISEDERRARVEKHLLMVGLEKFMHHRPSQLSGANDNAWRLRDPSYTPPSSSLPMNLQPT